jgi:hypothetical protein
MAGKPVSDATTVMTEAEDQAFSAEWLNDYASFWKVRGRFYSLAFGLGEGAVNPGAKRIPGAEEFFSLNQTVARQLWAQAMREEGGQLTAHRAAMLSSLSPKTRRAIASACADGLGLTPSGRARYVPYIEFDDDARWLGNGSRASGSRRAVDGGGSQ